MAAISLIDTDVLGIRAESVLKPSRRSRVAMASREATVCLCFRNNISAVPSTSRCEAAKSAPMIR
jgi:hypothetical protein